MSHRQQPGPRDTAPFAAIPAVNAARRVWLGCMVGVVCALAVMPSGVRAADEPVSEAEFKAALLIKLIRFVVWPDAAFSTPDAPLHIGVLGTHPFGKYLDRIAEGKSLEKHPFQIRYAANAEELVACHFVFVCRDRRPAMDEINKVFLGKPILLVGEEDRFANIGGMINVVVREQKPFLQINARAAELAGLRFRGQLAQTRNIEWIERPSAESK